MKRLVAAGWGQAVAALVQLVSLRIFSGVMAPDVFGLAMLGMGALAFADGLGAMAFSQVLAHTLKDLGNRQERAGLALGMAIPFTAWLAVLGLVGLVLAWWTMGWAGAVLTAIGLAAMLASEGLRTAGQLLAQLERRHLLQSLWYAVEALAVLGCSLLMLHLTDRQPAALVAGMLLGRSLASLLFAPLALGPVGTWRPDRQAARAVLPAAIGFCWSVVVMTPLGWLGVFADRYIVGATQGLAQAGMLAALTGAVVRPYAIATAGLTNIYRPDLLDEAANRAPQHPRPLRSWLLAALSIGLAGIVGTALLGRYLADFLVRYETPGIDRGLLMVLIAVSQMLVLMTHAVDSRLLATGRSKALLGSQIAVTVLGLPLIALGSIWIGLIGAALGRCANELLKLLAAWFVSVRTVRQSRDNGQTGPAD